MRQKGLFKAIKYCGSQQALANALGVTQPYVNHLLNRDKEIPDLHVLAILSLTRGCIPLEELTSNPKRIRKLIESATFFDKFPEIILSTNEIKMGNIQCPIYKNTEYSNFNLQDHSFSRPVLIDFNNQLITCACRISANNFLNNTIVSVHRINLSDVVTGKLSIKPLLELFPISEKIAIAIAIKREFGNRQGKRTDLKHLLGSKNNHINHNKCNELVDKYPQVQPGDKTRAVVAKISGFSSDYSYRQAKVVIEQGIPELIRAMDNHICTISKAKEIAELSKNEQYKYIDSISKKYNGGRKIQEKIGRINS